MLCLESPATSQSRLGENLRKVSKLCLRPRNVAEASGCKFENSCNFWKRGDLGVEIYLTKQMR